MMGKLMAKIRQLFGIVREPDCADQSPDRRRDTIRRKEVDRERMLHAVQSDIDLFKRELRILDDEIHVQRARKPYHGR